MILSLEDPKKSTKKRLHAVGLSIVQIFIGMISQHFNHEHHHNVFFQ